MANNMLDIDREFPGTVVQVPLGERSYPIYVGSGIYGLFGDEFRRHCGNRRPIVITDDNVEAHYGQTILDSLRKAGLKPEMLSVKPGEASKSAATLEGLYEQLFELAAERSDVIVALGGGVVGDLAGYVAATFKRGIAFVQVPTSLLAMVDSSIGGKTGINHPRGKNMIGAFHQPRLVFADTASLNTLPKRELGCGLAETVKHSVIRDAGFFCDLEADADRIMRLDAELMVSLVVTNCRIKAAVVGDDERESALRGILNFGHTIGHTLETVLPGHPYHHGEAVSLGMVGAARLAVDRALLTPTDLDRLIALLHRVNLPTSLAGAPPTDLLYEAMLQDKKVKAGKITFVLPTGLGSCTFVDDITESQIKAAIESLA